MRVRYAISEEPSTRQYLKSPAPAQKSDGQESDPWPENAVDAHPIPFHGVGRFAAIRGAIQTDQSAKRDEDHQRSRGGRFPNAAAPNPITISMGETDTI